MHFCHSSGIWRDFSALVPAALFADGITNDALVGERVGRFYAIAEARLAASAEGELPEIQAWRRAFAKMGLKPTQYRCASESLLRRFKKERQLPQLHPLIDLCNAISMAFAIPLAVFDVAKIADGIEVRYASGDEHYVTFSGETEHPEAGEVIFADGAARAHARRWTNRQSGYSAVGDATTAVLIVAEAMHVSALADVEKLVAALATELGDIWSIAPRVKLLSPSSPRLEF